MVVTVMIEKGTYVELAKANATAVNGMQPKISIWNTGSEAGSTGATGQGSGQDSAATLRNVSHIHQTRSASIHTNANGRMQVYQLLPPLMSTIHDQTGITLPEWQFGRMPNSEVARRDANNSKVNGK